jgi:hypothetical protein
MVRVFSLKNMVMTGFMFATRPSSSSCRARKDVMYSTPILSWNLRALRLLARMPTSDSEDMLNEAPGRPSERR